MQILWPAFAMFALTSLVVVRMGLLRAAALQDGRVRLALSRMIRTRSPAKTRPHKA